VSESVSRARSAAVMALQDREMGVHFPTGLVNHERSAHKLTQCGGIVNRRVRTRVLYFYVPDKTPHWSAYVTPAGFVCRIRVHLDGKICRFGTLGAQAQ
jgi:hypothetical protein